MTVWDHGHNILPNSTWFGLKQQTTKGSKDGSAFAFLLFWFAFFAVLALANYLAALIF